MLHLFQQCGSWSSPDIWRNLVVSFLSPTWDLSLVLEAWPLWPFESIDLRFLSHKTALYLSLASAKCDFKFFLKHNKVFMSKCFPDYLCDMGAIHFLSTTFFLKGCPHFNLCCSIHVLVQDKRGIGMGGRQSEAFLGSGCMMDIYSYLSSQIWML